MSWETFIGLPPVCLCAIAGVLLLGAVFSVISLIPSKSNKK